MGSLLRSEVELIIGKTQKTAKEAFFHVFSRRRISLIVQIYNDFPDIRTLPP
jgi:hypothetical protein